MLGNGPGKRLTEYVNDYVLYDLETTGVSPTKDEVIEISAVKVRNGKIVDEFTTLVNPGKPIPRPASMVNGIHDDMVADAPSFEKALKEFDEFIGEDVLVGHNIVRFDNKFINRDANKFWGMKFTNDYLDTLELSWRDLPNLEKHNLAFLANYFNISSKGAHRALNDCKINQAVYEAMKESIV